MQKGIFFDFDGVIANSIDLVLKCANRTMKELNQPIILYENDLRSLNNMELSELLRSVGLPEKYFQEVQDKINEYLLADLDKLAFFPDILGIIDSLQNEYLLGVITNNAAEFVNNVFENRQMTKCFTFISGFEPNIDVLNKANRIKKVLEVHCLEAKNCVMIGDAVSDILAGKEAGVKTIAATWGFQAQAILETAQPDALAHAPRELEFIVKKILR